MVWWAGCWACIWIRETAAVNDVAIDLLDAKAGERVVEIGCGPGRALGWLAAEGATVCGVDVSPAMLAAARRRNAHLVAEGRLELLLGDGTNLPLNDDSADAVLGVHTIYFWPDPATTLAEVARVLRPGGRLSHRLTRGRAPAAAPAGSERLPGADHATAHELTRAGRGSLGVEVRWRPEGGARVSAWATSTVAGRVGRKVS